MKLAKYEKLSKVWRYIIALAVLLVAVPAIFDCLVSLLVVTCIVAVVALLQAWVCVLDGLLASRGKAKENRI